MICSVVGVRLLHSKWRVPCGLGWFTHLVELPHVQDVLLSLWRDAGKLLSKTCWFIVIESISAGMFRMISLHAVVSLQCLFPDVFLLFWNSPNKVSWSIGAVYSKSSYNPKILIVQWEITRGLPNVLKSACCHWVTSCGYVATTSLPKAIMWSKPILGDNNPTKKDMASDCLICLYLDQFSLFLFD